MILWPLIFMMIARPISGSVLARLLITKSSSPALHTAPTQKVRARRLAATGKEKPRNVDCTTVSYVAGDARKQKHSACGEEIDELPNRQRDQHGDRA